MDTASSSYEPPPAFIDGCAAIGVVPSAEQMATLQAYLTFMLATNEQFNLTAVRDPSEAWMRHILDSLSLLPFIGQAESLMDVGSGAGLPGLVVAIMRPEMDVTLVEATGKKAHFLAEAAAELELDADRFRVVQARSEDLCNDPEYRETIDVVTARGVGALRALIEYTLPLIRWEGCLLAMKGARGEEEVKEARQSTGLLGGQLSAVHRALPGINEDACIVEIEKIKPSPERFPRAYGIIKKNPL